MSLWEEIFFLFHKYRYGVLDEDMEEDMSHKGTWRGDAWDHMCYKYSTLSTADAQKAKHRY